ncbi:hypothetical protein G9C98_001831 [Cotesia typhae]|uniref:Carbohydrate kinase FGGY N-terminal domain-containing protein n=1 Tax=Cotesia typhae TaxID=2053667 RepID=A0A8J5QTR3_9HYME|nr:hypothetical protein G9C98_001831 [Cotesia typhae]
MPETKRNPCYVGSIDEGTSSARFLIFDVTKRKVITSHQIEIKQKYPQEGWVEQDPKEILSAVLNCIEKVVENLEDIGIAASEIKAIGITNQRETTVVWDKNTGEPLHNAIVRPNMVESTALGAAILAGVGAGLFEIGDVDASQMTKFSPQISEDERDLRYSKWKMAVERSMKWDLSSSLDN